MLIYTYLMLYWGLIMNETNDSNFSKNVLENELPVVVDFWAEWCGPCKMLMPVFEELSHEYDGKINFIKANTEENQSISEDRKSVV